LRFYFTSNKINITSCLYSINILYKQSVNGKISGDLKKLTVKSILVKLALGKAAAKAQA
jgi:hypothetical protein